MSVAKAVRLRQGRPNPISLAVPVCSETQTIFRAGLATPFAGRNFSSTGLTSGISQLGLVPAISLAKRTIQPTTRSGVDFPPRREQCFGTGTTHSDHLNSRAGAFDGVLQVESDLAGLDPKQMVPDAFVIPVGDADREDIDVPCRDLQRMVTIVEKLRVAAIQHDARRQRTCRALIGRGRPLEEAFVHSWATSLA